MKKMVIIDGKSVFYRGYHAMGRLALSDGTPTGGVYGFAVIAMELVDRIKPNKVVIAWDKAKTSVSQRVLLYPEYKAGRAKPGDDFYVQIPLIRELADGLNWEFLECDNYEADDIIGTLATQARKAGEWETYIISSDQDMLQVVGENVKMLRLMKGFSELEEVDIVEFEQKYEIKQHQFLDLKALAGDSSDNIPGVSGVGQKTAIKILQTVDNIEELYGVIEDGENEENSKLDLVISKKMREKLLAGKEMAILSKKLAKIMLDAPVDFLKVRDFVWDKQNVYEILKKLEFLSLIKKFGLESKNELKKEKDLKENYVNYDIKNWDNMIVAWDIKTKMHEDSRIAEDILRGKKYYDLEQARFLLDLPIRSGIFDYASDDIKKQEYLKQQKAFSSQEKLKKVLEELDLPLIPILYKMEKRGMMISVDKFRRLAEELGEEVVNLEKEIWEMAGVNFNINSPMQLSQVLFETLGLPTKGIAKKSRGYSTGAKELSKLSGKHVIIEKIKDYREKKKLLSTYIEPLPRLADENGRIHTTFTQNITSTGRLSSVNPNLQNIPVRTEEGRKIRAGFVAPEGRVLVSADYAQFELRLASILANDESLVNDFNNGVDIHTKTASDVFGVGMSEVMKEQRRAAKVINFGVLYGMSAKGLADAAKMSFFEADKFIKDYFKVRYKIDEYLKRVLVFAKQNGYVETFYGRRRSVPDVNAGNYIVRTAAERAAMNMPIQGTEADLMKKAMIEVDRALPVGAEMVCQVHDSLIVECDEGLEDEVVKILKEKMEGVAPELGVKLLVDVSVGRNWGEL